MNVERVAVVVGIVANVIVVLALVAIALLLGDARRRRR